MEFAYYLLKITHVALRLKALVEKASHTSTLNKQQQSNKKWST